MNHSSVSSHNSSIYIYQIRSRTNFSSQSPLCQTLDFLTTGFTLTDLPITNSGNSLAPLSKYFFAFLRFKISFFLMSGGSGDLRQGSSNNSVTNFVKGFPYVFQREKQPPFEDLLLVVLVILRRRFPTRFRPKVSLSISRFQNSIFGFPFDLPVLQFQFCTQKTGKSLKISNPSGSFH